MKQKEILIQELKIAEINFLMSIKNIKPEFVAKQVQKDVNHIAWIVGHCISHMDLFLSFHTGTRIFSEVERKYFAYGVSKEEIEVYPFSFRELMDKYLEISANYFEILENLTDEEYDKIPHPDAKETITDLIHRISLHIMGHTGQIVLLRRMFDNLYWGFVCGIEVSNREKLRLEWLKWWKENKSKY